MTDKNQRKWVGSIRNQRDGAKDDSQPDNRTRRHGGDAHKNERDYKDGDNGDSSTDQQS